MKSKIKNKLLAFVKKIRRDRPQGCCPKTGTNASFLPDIGVFALLGRKANLKKS